MKVDSRRKSLATLEHAHPGARFIDVTSRGPEPWVRFSPFFPHGGVPVPFSPGRTARSVEGIWQGLKVFRTADVDPSRFDITSMSGIKRTTRTLGETLGHRKGVSGTELLSYLDARRRIYLPAYRFVLEHRVADLVEDLRRMSRETPIVLLDYETNTSITDLSRPLSHAGLIVHFIAGTWPGDGSERGRQRQTAGEE